MFFFNFSGTALPYIIYFAALSVYIMLGSMNGRFREDETLYSEDLPPMVSEYTAPVSTLMETAYTVTFHQPAGAGNLLPMSFRNIITIRMKAIPVFHRDRRLSTRLLSVVITSAVHLLCFPDSSGIRSLKSIMYCSLREHVCIVCMGCVHEDTKS